MELVEFSKRFFTNDGIKHIGISRAAIKARGDF
jgi:hypothetical protein